MQNPTSPAPNMYFADLRAHQNSNERKGQLNKACSRLSKNDIYISNTKPKASERSNLNGHTFGGIKRTLDEYFIGENRDKPAPDMYEANYNQNVIKKNPKFLTRIKKDYFKQKNKSGGHKNNLVLQMPPTET